MLRLLLLSWMTLTLIAPLSVAKIIDNPEAVGYLHAEVLKEGSFVLESTGPGARVSEIEIRHSVPQGTNRQITQLTSVQGPDSHGFDEDDYGNEIIVLTWKNPPLDQEIGYQLAFDVQVWDRDDFSLGGDFPITYMIEPDQGITEKAYEISRGLTTMEKFMEMTSYVYELVDYDRTYQNVQKSARWVFDNQMAVCDGHSNLLISMLRSLGYNAYYVIGYAYTEENQDPDTQGYWGPHGWVEVEHEGKALSLDPTWLEHPVDATHIKFAIAPDSNYTEYVQILANNVNLDWDKGDYVVTMIESRTEPRISIHNRLLPQNPGSEEHSLMITGLESREEGCVLTRLRIQGCEESGRQFLGFDPTEKHIGLCEKESHYWILSVPSLRSGVEYGCSVSVHGGGASTNNTVTAYKMPDTIDIRISTPKVLTPNQFFRVNTTVENKGLFDEELELFLMLEDVVQEYDLSIDPLQAADITWTARAPGSPGAYPLRFFSSSGDLIEEEIRVIEKRNIEISSLDIPDNISLDDSLQLNITLRGLEDCHGEIKITMGSSNYEREFTINRGEEKALLFVYTPESEGNKHVNIVLLSGEGSYEAGLVDSFEVIRIKEWWEPILEAIKGVLEAIFRGLGMSS
jgi:hypothetical protein